MDERQVIYPTIRLLANPKIFIAIANYLEGPDWETIAGAFYDLIEGEFLEDDELEPEFLISECAFREKPDEMDVFQVVLPSGNAIELRPGDGDGDDKKYSAITSEDELGIVSAIYGRLIRAIETECPELKGDIVLCDPPTPSNGYLRDENGDAFRGEFHLLSDPEKMYHFTVDVISMEDDDLKASVLPIISM